MLIMSIDGTNIPEAIENAKQILASDETLSPQVRTLIQLLIVIVQLLVNKIGINSRNSSKPPSMDPNRARGRRRKAGAVKRKSGGQPGREGVTLEQIAKPDVVERIDIDRSTLPKGHRYKPAGFEKRQVIDIVIKRKVTEYQAEAVVDEQGQKWVAAFPEGVSRYVQYGNGLKAKAVYMAQAQLIPYKRVEDYFKGQCQIPISQGSLYNFNKQAYGLLEDFEKLAKEKLIQSKVLHNDETGINIGGHLRWLHSASSEKWTLFFPHEKRGTDAMKEFGILPTFKGVSVHDHWTPYLSFDCEHAFCNAHHLRELERAWEQDGMKWAKNMRRILIKINDAVDKAGGKLSKKKADIYHKKYRSLLCRADQECPAPERKGPQSRGRPKKERARNLLERLRDYECEVLRFMTDKDVPFTNNLAERDIRMTKVQQKISGCFRSWEGAQFFCRIRSFLSTCRKHGIDPADGLRLLFEGKLPAFLHSK